MVSRLVAVPALLLVAACATTTSTSRSSLSPQRGPRAHITASYQGGMLNRTVRPSFRVERNAYALVGHLGGDGRITILFPEDAMSPASVRGGRTYQTHAIQANYDAVPQLFSLASRAVRSVGARIDSYDGRGNGFVFIIATLYPMYTESIQDQGFWATDLEVEGYHSSSDPRVAIRDLADELARGMPYTLDYADSYGSTPFTSNADAQFDCSVLSSTLLGFMPDYFGHYGWWAPITLTGPSWYFFRPAMFYTDRWSVANACAPRSYSRYYAFGSFHGPWCTGHSHGFTLLPQLPRREPKPPFTFSTTSRRPGFRNSDESGPAISLTRTRLTGQRERASTATLWMPPRTGTTAPRRERFEPRSSMPRSGQPGVFSGTRSGSAGTSTHTGSFGTMTRTQTQTTAPASPARAPEASAPRAETSAARNPPRP